MFGKQGMYEVAKLGDKIYLIAHYDTPRQTAWVELNDGLPEPLVLAREAQREAQKRREVEAAEDKEFQRLYQEELSRNDGKIKAAIGKAAAEEAAKARKKVEKMLGRKMHGESKDPPVEELIQEEE